MKTNKLWIVVTAVMVCQPASHGETAVLQPVSDTTLHERFPDNNVGGHFDLAAGGIATGERTRALIRFDLRNKIPINATITSAKLALQVTREPSSGGIDSTFELRRVNRSWNEGTKSSPSGQTATDAETTWNKRIHATINWAAPGGSLSDDFVGQASATVEVKDRTAYTFGSTPALVEDVQGWLNDPSSNFGWVLMSQSERTAQTARRFASREDSARAPTLTVEYSVSDTKLRITSVAVAGNNATIGWQGGSPLYQVQRRASLADSLWENVGSSTANSSVQIPISAASGFFRVMQVPNNVIAESAEYEVVFESTWSPATHPQDFPSGAHWSPLIGGTHNSGATFWTEGIPATQGIKDVAEVGSVVALRNEVTAAIAKGTADQVLFRAGSIAGSGNAAMNFTAHRNFPLVTLVTMIAPSPDWFTGVHGLGLIEDGQWVSQKVVVLGLYDAGTDSGSTYNSLDADTQPREPIRQITGFPALVNGALVPFAKYTFRRK